MLNGQNTLPSYRLFTCAGKMPWHSRGVIPRQLWLVAIFALYLGYVAVHYVVGQVPLWAYLGMGNGISAIAIALLRHEQRRVVTRTAARLRDLRSSPAGQG